MNYRISLLLYSLFLTACTSDKPCYDGLITASITVDYLPPSLNYYNTPLPQYSWGVIFDANNDGSINKGDLALDLSYNYTTGGFVAFLFDYRSETRRASITKISSGMADNTITLSVCKGAHSSLLNNVNESTLVNFYSSAYDPESDSRKYDYYPSYRVLSNIPGDYNFTDPQGDAYFTYIDIVNMKITF